LVEISEIIFQCTHQITVSDLYDETIAFSLINYRFTGYHTVWHGVRKDVSDYYREGDQLSCGSLISATSSLNALQVQMLLVRAKTRTMFAIETKNGKIIRAHSHLQNHEEILLLPGIVLQVTGSLKGIGGVHTIYLREIEPLDLQQMDVLPLLEKPSPVQGMF
jgi:hypothetical protein